MKTSILFLKLSLKNKLILLKSYFVKYKSKYIVFSILTCYCIEGLNIYFLFNK